MTKYLVKGSLSFRVDGKRCTYEKGDTVELTPEFAARIDHRFIQEAPEFSEPQLSVASPDEAAITAEPESGVEEPKKKIRQRKPQ